MSEYHLDINGNIELSDYSSIQDYMKIVDVDDKVTISINNSLSDEARIICEILKDDKFYIISQGGDKSGKYYIEAEKKR
jgi:hypothetical protein